MNRNGKLIAAALFSGMLLASPQDLFAESDSIKVRRVTSDVLVNTLRSELGQTVYFLKDGEDVANYTIGTTRDRFTEEAFELLESKGYKVVPFDGAYFVSSGKYLSPVEIPSDYFALAAKTDTKEESSSEDNLTATFRNKIYEIGDKTVSGKKKAFVRGYVRDIQSGEPLVGISVYDEKTNAYALTDVNGFYRVELPVGENVLCYSGYSMEDLKLNLVLYDDGGLDVGMKEKVISLKGAVITADNQPIHRDPRMGVEIIRLNTIKKVPVAFGEADVLKVVLTLPGVKTAGEASTGFNVRGGAVDQNLILFNDGTIFYPSHMFGVLSSFNADVINDVQLYKSSIPAEYGGRISSVLDIRGKEGNANKLAGAVGIGLLTSSIALEGPIRKGKTTFVLNGRTTYSDWMLKAIPRDQSNYSGGSAAFGDVNLGITHKFNANNSISASGYWSRDKFGFSRDTLFRYSNLNVSLKWVSHFNERHTMTLVSGYDSYSSTLTDSGYYLQAYNLSTDIRQGFLKLTFKSSLGRNGRHALTYGLHGIYLDLNPGSRDPLDAESKIVPLCLDKQRAADLSLFVGDTWMAGEKLSFEYGIRMNAYLSLNDKKKYFNPEFRLSGKYSFTPNLSVKAGYNTMSQNIHLISNNTSISPMDTWQLSNSRIRPQTGWQGAAGVYWTTGPVDITLEGYYKRMYHYLDYRSGAVLTLNPSLVDDLIETTGKAYGVELLARKNLGKLNGWVSYSYSRSLIREVEDRGVETINGGDWYSTSYDKPHDFKMVMNYRFTHRFSVSVNADYSTGRPVTLPVSKYWYANTYMMGYSDRNAYRIPDYFRLDAAIIIEPSHYLKKLTHLSVTVGVYNVTGRKNAYSVFYTAGGSSAVNGYMLSVFACPIPYVNFNLKF